MSSQEVASVPIGGEKKPTFSRELSRSFVVQAGTRTKQPKTRGFVDLDCRILCTYQSPQRCLTNLEHLLFRGKSFRDHKQLGLEVGADKFDKPPLSRTKVVAGKPSRTTFLLNGGSLRDLIW